MATAGIVPVLLMLSAALFLGRSDGAITVEPTAESTSWEPTAEPTGTWEPTAEPKATSHSTFGPAGSSKVKAENAIVDHVIHIVVDGLRPDAMPGNTNFDYVISNGACTRNARLDPLSSQTLPNHISMFGGRATSEHGYLEDVDDGGRLPSGPTEDIFDLVKASGGTTGFFGSKTKFDLFNRSWGIDSFNFEKRSFSLIPLFMEKMLENQFTYAFLHIRSPDRAGHGGQGAESDVYREAVAEADYHLGQVLGLIGSLEGDTGIILTADHGFAKVGNHADESDPDVYRIPFCVLGPGVSPGADLYDINRSNGVVDPGNEQANNIQSRAIRNVYAGVLAADMLGLRPSFGPLSDQYLAISNIAVGSPAEEESNNVLELESDDVSSSSTMFSDAAVHSPVEEDNGNVWEFESDDVRSSSATSSDDASIWNPKDQKASEESVFSSGDNTQTLNDVYVSSTDNPPERTPSTVGIGFPRNSLSMLAIGFVVAVLAVLAAAFFALRRARASGSEIACKPKRIDTECLGGEIAEESFSSQCPPPKAFKVGYIIAPVTGNASEGIEVPITGDHPPTCSIDSSLEAVEVNYAMWNSL